MSRKADKDNWSKLMRMIEDWRVENKEFESIGSANLFVSNATKSFVRNYLESIAFCLRFSLCKANI